MSESFTVGDNDEVEVTLNRGVGEPVRQTYRVISDAGLFKNGQQYNAGDTIELDEDTARRFIETGDIEAV